MFNLYWCSWKEWIQICILFHHNLSMPKWLRIGPGCWLSEKEVAESVSGKLVSLAYVLRMNRRKLLQKHSTMTGYFDLARELKKLRNMQVTIIPIVIGAFGTVTKGLLHGLEDLEIGGRVETIQTIALLRRARILRRVRETWGDLLSLRLHWKTIG